MAKKYTYLVVDNSPYSLPVAVFDTALEVAHFLMCDRVYVEFLIRWGTYYKGEYAVIRM